MNNVSEGIREITCRIFENKGVMSCVFFLGRLFSCNKKIGTEIVFVCIETHSLSLSLFFPYSSMQHFFYSTVDLFGCTNRARIFKAKYKIKLQKYFPVLKLYLKQCFVYTTSNLFQKNLVIILRLYFETKLKKMNRLFVVFLRLTWIALLFVKSSKTAGARKRGGWLINVTKNFRDINPKRKVIKTFVFSFVFTSYWYLIRIQTTQQPIRVLLKIR